jgi:hypothetical protein
MPLVSAQASAKRGRRGGGLRAGGSGVGGGGGGLTPTTICPKGATCRGALRVTARGAATRGRRATLTTIASSAVRTVTGTRRTTLRLTPTGRRMLRSGRGRLSATLRWTPAGGARPATRSVRLEGR